MGGNGWKFKGTNKPSGTRDRAIRQKPAETSRSKFLLTTDQKVGGSSPPGRASNVSVTRSIDETAHGSAGGWGQPSPCGRASAFPQPGRSPRRQTGRRHGARSDHLPLRHVRHRPILQASSASLPQPAEQGIGRGDTAAPLVRPEPAAHTEAFRPADAASALTRPHRLPFNAVVLPRPSESPAAGMTSGRTPQVWPRASAHHSPNGTRPRPDPGAGGMRSP